MVISFRIARIRQVVQNHILSKRNDGLSDYPGKIFTGLKALDVGCGGGLLSESLARLGADVTAVDPSSEIVRMAKQHSQRDEEIAHKINYRGGSSVEQLASEILDQHGKARNSDLFDIVCVLEVIEHSSDPASLLSGASSLLKRPTDTCPGGILFVSTINKTAKSFAFAILGAEYITGMLPVGTHSWNQFFSPNDVSNLVRDQGLSEIDVCGMVLRPGFQLDFQLDENDTDVNWIAAYARK